VGLREGHGLRVFENRVLRRIFGPKRDEVTGEWRKLHNEELRNVWSSPSMIRNDEIREARWVMYVACTGRSENVGNDGKTRMKETTRRTQRWYGVD
jgi:hypothetical protein